MSVNSTVYLVYGIKLPYGVYNEYNIDSDDKYTPYIEGNPDVVYNIIKQDENANDEDNCIIFGKVLQKIDIEEYDTHIYSIKNKACYINNFASEYSNDLWHHFDLLFPLYPYSEKVELELLMFQHLS